MSILPLWALLISLVSPKFAHAEIVVKDKMLYELAKCESGLNELALNPRDPITRSVGLFQFKDTTWARYLKKYDLGDLDIWNGDAQLVVARKMYDDEEVDFYREFPTCAKIIKFQK